MQTKMIDIISATKTNFVTTVNSETDYPGDDNMKIGCLQRIAAATEAMAKNHVKLQQDYDYMRKDRDRYRERLRSAENKIRTMKGVITKLKKK